MIDVCVCERERVRDSETFVDISKFVIPIFFLEV